MLFVKLPNGKRVNMAHVTGYEVFLQPPGFKYEAKVEASLVGGGYNPSLEAVETPEITLYQGSKAECEAFLAKLEEECDSPEYLYVDLSDYPLGSQRQR